MTFFTAEDAMTKMKTTSDAVQFRQGDVFLMRASKMPDGEYAEVPRDDGRVVLAYGEVTGHAHAIRTPGVCLLRAEGINDRVLTVDAQALLEHEEHGSIALDPGIYVVRVQREWTGEDERQVQD